MKLSKILVFCVSLSFGALHQSALAQGSNSTQTVQVPISESVHQAYTASELSLYMLYPFFKIVPAVTTMKTPADLLGMLGTLGLLDLSAMAMHLPLEGAAEIERYLTNSTAPRLQISESTKSPRIDTALAIEQRYVFSTYGGLTVLLKLCRALRLKSCQADVGLSLLLDQYFPFDFVLTTSLKALSKIYNVDSSPAQPSQPAVEPLANFNSVDDLATIVNLAVSFAQLSAYVSSRVSNNRAYADSLVLASQARGVFCVVYFSWLGLNNLPLLLFQAMNLGEYVFTALSPKNDGSVTPNVKAEL